MKWISIVILTVYLLPGKTLAQPGYRAALANPDTAAFYRIDLPYQVLGGACPDLADIRIVNNEGKEVAWLLKEEVESKHNVEFIPLSMKISTLPKRTDVIITSEGKPLSSFLLKMKNTDVNKEASLLGSNDTEKWFAVKNHIGLSSMNSTVATGGFLEIKFPLSDYQYYKLSISDSLSAPLNILSVGCVKTEAYSKKHLLPIPLTASHIRTKGKQTDIELVLPFKFQIERLDFYISSPRYYHRTLELSRPVADHSAAKLSDEKGSPQPIFFSAYGDTLKLSVYNGDDQPLAIDSVKAFARKYYLIASLEKGVTYTLTYGDPKAEFPQYDLSFEKFIPDSISRLALGNIEKTVVEQSSQQPEQPSPWLDFLKTYGIWIVIVIVIVQILWMVTKMLKK